MIFHFKTLSRNFKYYGCIVCFIAFILAYMTMPRIRFFHYRHYRNPRDNMKFCMSNIRIIQGAVEMYNMDNDKEKMMEILDIDMLIKEKYLKPVSKPEISCEYYSVGDLSVDGEVACKEHGSLSNPNEKYVESRTNNIKYEIKEFFDYLRVYLRNFLAIRIR